MIEQAEELQSATEDLGKIATTKLQDLSDLRQSLLQKAFAGELTGRQEAA